MSVNICRGHLPAKRLEGGGEEGGPERTGSLWAVSLGFASAQQEQRKSRIKTNSVNGNTKTLLTSSPPKGPHPYPPVQRHVQGAAGSLKTIPFPKLCTCVSILTFASTRVSVRKRLAAHLDGHRLSPSGHCLRSEATLPVVGLPYLGPSLSASGPVSCLSQAQGCVSNAGSTRPLALSLLPSVLALQNSSIPTPWKCRWKL